MKPARRVTEIPLTQIHTSAIAMRTSLDNEELADLASSMSSDGLINPILVTVETDGYRLIAGHRRCAAAESLGWKTITATIAHLDPLAQARAAWSENAHRADITPMDRASWLRAQLETTQCTQSELARQLQMPISTLSELLATLDYPEPLRDAIQSGQLQPRAARELAQIDDDTVRHYYTAQAIEYGATTRTIAEWVRQFRASCIPAGNPADQVDPSGQLSLPETEYIAVCPGCHQAITNRVAILRVCHDCAQAILAPQPTR